MRLGRILVMPVARVIHWHLCQYYTAGTY
jgi:hypothetical protein